MEKKSQDKAGSSEPSFFHLIDFDGAQNAILFNGQRQVMTGISFVGFLHRELVRVQGWRRSQGLLLRLGFTAGYTDCQELRASKFTADEDELLRAGLHFNSMKGLARTRVDTFEVDRPKGVFRFTGIFENSLEALWHRHFLGAAPAPVCWLLTGYMSGFCSAWWGDEVLVREVECAGTGRTSQCRFEAAPAGSFGEREQEEMDLIRYPSLGDDLSKLGAAPALAGTAAVDTSAPGPDVFRVARGAGIMGRSKALEHSLKLALQVAVMDTTVLLVGESGTGKELFARMIHDRSPRERSPFVAVNCSALPETLLESELFGHVKGSFTGAVETRKGLFEAAHRGTILLDEIGEMSPATQVKLLRVIQDREVRPVGGNRGAPVDVRILAATNRDLDRMVREGTFREDLYYRLKVFPIEIPPLRKRREDVVPLARHFLTRFSRSTGKKVNSLTPAALQALSRHSWPGNVRELENMLERAVVLATGDRIGEEDLDLDAVPEWRGLQPADADPPLSLRELEKAHILRVFAREDGHRQKTAKVLGIGTNTLWRKLKEYGADLPGPGTR